MKSLLNVLFLIFVVMGVQSLFAEKIVVWNLTPEKGVTDKDSATVTAILIGEIEKISKMDIISEKDIRSIIQSEETRKSCSTEDNSCIAEIGAALGSPYSVTGTLSRMGGYWVVSLQLLDVQKVEAKARVSKKFKGGENALLESVTPLVCELFNDTACLEKLKEKQPSEWKKTAGWTFFSLGSAALVFGGISNWQMNEAKSDYLETGADRKSTYDGWKAAAITGYVAGSVFLVTGISFLVADAVGNKKPRKETAVLYFVPTGGGFFMGLSGRW